MHPKTLKSVQLILALQLVSELIEELKHTNYYRQEIKQKANSLEKSMEPIMRKELTDLYESSPQTIINVLRHQEQLIERIAQELEPHALCAFNMQLSQMLNKNETEWPAVEMLALRA